MRNISSASIGRREFLQAATGAAVGAAIAPTELRASSESVKFCAPEAWTKRGIVMQHHGEPQGGWVQNFTCSVEPLKDGRWRWWCGVSGKETVPKNIGVAEGRPGEKITPTYAVLTSGEPDRTAPLSIGNLPEGWRPIQAVHLQLLDGRKRLYFWAHATGVVRYLAADSDDGRAYRVVDPLRPCIYHPADRAVDGSASLELGLTRFAKRVAAPVEGEPLAPSALISNDATNVYQLPDGTFEMYSVGLIQVGKDHPGYMPHDNVAGLIRVIDRYTSADGLRWGDRQRVITPDADDPHDLQFYYLSVTHTERGRVGMLGHYRLEAQTIDIEPCFSADGVHWQRPARRPWLPRGDSTQIDSYILHSPHSLVQRDGKWWLFYTGGNFSHNHRDSHGDPTRAVMLATAESIWA